MLIIHTQILHDKILSLPNIDEKDKCKLNNIINYLPKNNNCLKDVNIINHFINH
jgi:hypothetical protein